jgi:cysteine desulfurase
MPQQGNSRSKSKSKKSKESSKAPSLKFVRKKSPVRNPGLCAKKIIYLDNNATTLICPEAELVYKQWLKCYNPSSSSAISQGAAAMMDKVRNSILKHCGTDHKSYTVVFTSGATESNCFILRSCVESYRKIRQIKPHIIISSIEHHSILECAKLIEEAGYADVSMVAPNMFGCILPADVEKAIRPNTCLISIMYANNETGSINNIPQIGEIAHSRKIPLHTDAVQIFGKYPIPVEKNNIDAMSVSFHKLYGSKGIGLLILKNDLIEGYDLKGQINGSQESGLRGGTENPPAIASCLAALKCNFKNRKVKNQKLLKMRDYIIDQLGASDLFGLGNYANYLDPKFVDGLKDVELVILGPPRDKVNYYLPNTLLISIATPHKKFCNVELKKDLDRRGIVVSISSACLTSSSKSSHVLSAIGAPDIIKRGVLRISLGDNNTMEELEQFMPKFLDAVKMHLA